MLRRLILPLLFGAFGVTVLVSLGIWQMHRLEWKEGVLAEIDARIGAAPVDIPDQPDPEDDRFLPVKASGRTTGQSVLVQSSHKQLGAGFRLIEVFETDERRILLDRGFLRAADKKADFPPVDLTVAGNLHWPDEVDGFTPEPDIETGLWFARDIPSLSDYLGTEPVLLVLRTSDDDNADLIPLPVDSSGIPNDHLEYAITWFLLAVVWAVMTGYLIYTLRARTTEGPRI
ncbi:SURF1 family protein [Qingshengfaniella alkalisoli]|uniref:SURF1-like protein n=1 Tax=Qingshengfaniella alkalisoli TaxID=2599296 RepID=A0A5B8IV75_9RHOB|nr:SURF1 family protein [Qingshengfaniella alkalisoli]QDY69514.1 SURF1 family protein [Qingshengfaniella alkalisoli]